MLVTLQGRQTEEDLVMLVVVGGMLAILLRVVKLIDRGHDGAMAICWDFDK